MKGFNQKKYREVQAINNSVGCKKRLINMKWASHSNHVKFNDLVIFEVTSKHFLIKYYNTIALHEMERTDLVVSIILPWLTLTR